MFEIFRSSRNHCKKVPKIVSDLLWRYRLFECPSPIYSFVIFLIISPCEIRCLRPLVLKFGQANVSLPVQYTHFANSSAVSRCCSLSTVLQSFSLCLLLYLYERQLLSSIFVMIQPYDQTLAPVLLQVVFYKKTRLRRSQLILHPSLRSVFTSELRSRYFSALTAQSDNNKCFVLHTSILSSKFMLI